METEVWKDIPGYEGFYQASNLGNIRSLPRLVGGRWRGLLKRQPGRVMNGGLYSNGYCLVVLSIDGKHVTTSKHILVAKTFIPNTENKRCVNHKNSIRTDNRVENLEWVTHKENTHHGISKGRINLRGEDSPGAKLTWKQVNEIRALSGKLSDIALAKQYNISKSSIYYIKKGINWPVQ